MAAKLSNVKQGLDLNALMAMTEPLTVHVAQLRGSLRAPISLPLRQGFDVSGAGWEIADVKEINEAILTSPDGAGGGLFEVQVRDSSPDPKSMTFQTFIPPEMYANMRNPFGAPGGMPQQPNAGGWGATPAWGASGANPWGVPPAVPPSPYGGWTPPQRTPIPSFNGSSAVSGDEVARLREELHKRDLATIEERARREVEELRRQMAAPRDDGRYDRERERAERAEREAAEARRAAAEAEREARHQRELAELRASIAAQAAPKHDDAVAEMRREMLALEERRRQDAALAEERRRADAAIAAATAKTGPDPTIMLVMEMMKTLTLGQQAAATAAAEAAKESARLKAETDKEIARAQADAERTKNESLMKLVELTRSAAESGKIQPLDLIHMLREASNGGEEFTRNMIRSMTDFMGVQKDAVLNLLNMQPQGEGVAGRVVDGLREAVDTFAKTQAQTEASKASAAAQIARANADAEMARAGFAAGWQPPPQVTGGGLAGPPSVGAPALPAQTPAATSAAMPADPAAPTSEKPTVHGRTDEEWFGPALNDVQNFRKGVNEYLDAVSRPEVALGQPNLEPITVVDPRTKKPIGLSPFEAAKYLVMAAGLIARNQANGMSPVPAFDQLYAQQMYPALMEVLLPHAPAGYRVDVIRFLSRALAGAGSGHDGDEPMFGIAPFLMEEGDSDDDDDDAPAAVEVIPGPPPAAAAAAAAASSNGKPAAVAAPTKLLNKPHRPRA